MARGTDRGKRPARARAVASEVVDTARRIHATTAPTPSGSWSARDGSGRGGGGGASRRSIREGERRRCRRRGRVSADVAGPEEVRRARPPRKGRTPRAGGARARPPTFPRVWARAASRDAPRRDSRAARTRRGRPDLRETRASRAPRDGSRAVAEPPRGGEPRARPSRADPARRAPRPSPPRASSLPYSPPIRRGHRTRFSARPRELVVSASRDFRARRPLVNAGRADTSASVVPTPRTRPCTRGDADARASRDPPRLCRRGDAPIDAGFWRTTRSRARPPSGRRVPQKRIITSRRSRQVVPPPPSCSGPAVR